MSSLGLYLSHENAPGHPAHIRPYRKEDSTALIALINEIAAERVWLVTDHYVPTREWENALYHPADHTDHIILLAEIGGQVVGWCQVFPVTFGTKSRHVADLGIGVKQEWRDRGIGTALLKAAISRARGQRLEKLTLDVFSSNSRAIHVYAKAGFQRTGIRYRHFKIQDEYVDQDLMELFL